MRQYLVSTSNAVEAVIQGLHATSPFPTERVGSHFGVIYRGNSARNVKLLTGGGSGHEPLFLGAVGPGMADGAIAGEIFAAPNPDSILAVTEALQPCEGVIYLYGNYSGASGMLFGLFFRSAEQAQESDVLDLATLSALFDRGLDDLTVRTKAQPGDKTMFDALVPALTSLRESRGDLVSALDRAALQPCTGLKVPRLCYQNLGVRKLWANGPKVRLIRERLRSLSFSQD